MRELSIAQTHSTADLAYPHILKERFARGEIDEEQFDERRRCSASERVLVNAAKSGRGWYRIERFDPRLLRLSAALLKPGSLRVHLTH